MASNDQLVCCVCGDPVPEPAAIIGQRVYCDRHRAALDRPHPGFWQAGLVQILGMGLFTALVAAIAGNFADLEGRPLIAAGLFLALVPAALWLIFFYRQDRLEPEPKTRIALVFLLALLLTDALGQRVINDWFQVPRWAAGDALTSLLASILIVGFTLQGIAYVAVRVLVYATPEVDERMDGIVYGTVAGLGTATLLNLHHIIDNQGVALGPGSIHTATVTLAQASFSGIMGYFLAEAKFAHRPIWWVPLGVTIAAILNGTQLWLLSEVSASGLTVEPWRSLALGVVVALLVFALLVALMRRSTAVTLTATTAQGRAA